MKTKICFKCNKRKTIEQGFYKHPKTKDGYLGKCKECAKKDTIINIAEKYKNPVFVESERKRGREKYYRLGYRDKYTSSNEYRLKWELKYPEKKKARSVVQHISKQGYHAHHWSYNEEHYKDIIYLLIREHYKLHRYMKYSQPDKMYRTLEGTLLDTKQKHIDYFNQIKNL